ncbi:MAG: S-layer homology domain-containing protein [Clostridiales bacterium]|nr:S-layer homology domain-containing protein [Clostridiales bacterium]
MKKPIFYMFLIAALVLCSSAAAFAASDLSVWDSSRYVPPDVFGTKLQIPVKYLMDKKILTGDTDGLFHPEKNINRAEFATIMARATNNVVELETYRNENIFNDLDGYGWAKPYINTVAKAGLFKGRSSDKFAPAESVTYAEVITVLIRMNGAADAAESMAPKWPDNYIAYAEREKNKWTVDVVVSDWNAPATKGDTVLLLYRNLPKD